MTAQLGGVGGATYLLIVLCYMKWLQYKISMHLLICINIISRICRVMKTYLKKQQYLNIRFVKEVKNSSNVKNININTTLHFSKY